MIQPPQGHRIVMLDAEECLLVISSIKGWPPDEHFVEGRAQRINVCAGTQRERASSRLLGAHVEGRSEAFPGLGQVRLSFHPSQTKVEDSKASLCVQDQVGRLQV